MKTKLTLSLILSVTLFFSAGASLPNNSMVPVTGDIALNEQMTKLIKANAEAFLKITPKDYQKMTGHKLSFKETLKLKAAQKTVKSQMKKDGDGLTKGIYILLAIFGLAWIAMGVKDDWNGNNWWVNLILSLLCWLPGLIHALVKMKDYYK